MIVTFSEVDLLFGNGTGSRTSPLMLCNVNPLRPMIEQVRCKLQSDEHDDEDAMDLIRWALWAERDPARCWTPF